MDHSLTVVLPIHNCERHLRASVLDLLELAPSLFGPLAVVVVDDGSTDDTYETACELARLYPQVTVLRQSVRQGVGAALELVRNRLVVEQVVVHDGISAIDSAQLQALLCSECTDESRIEKAVPPATSTMESSGSRRFAAVRTLHDSLEHAHRSVTCFRWMQLEKRLVPRRRPPVDQQPAAQESALSGHVRAPVVPLPLASLPIGMTPLPQG